MVIQSIIAWEDQLSNAEVKYLSDRVIEISPPAGYPSLKAIKTIDGIVVIGALYDLELTREYRRIIEKEFDRDDFRYVISTSARVLSQGGIEAFPEAIHIAHSSVKETLLSYESRMDEIFAREIRLFNNKASLSRDILAEDPPGPNANQEQYNWMNFCQNIADYFASHSFEISLPVQTFEQNYTIELGDCPIDLIDFGPGYYGNDIIINLPSEGFLIAPAFSRLHLAPLPSSSADSSTFHHWLGVMDNLLEKKETIKQIYCGISSSISMEDMSMSRRYMQELWDAIAQATADGLDMTTTQQRLSLDGIFSYVKEWPIFANEGRAWVEDDHTRHFNAYWHWQHKNAAKAIEEALAEFGLAEAEKTFKEIRNDTTNIYYFQENLFNTLGYRLLGENRLSEAIAIFRMNIETHPESGNAYDSYGEALLNNNQKDLAIEIYRRSLELNPENTNARNVLEEIRAFD